MNRPISDFTVEDLYKIAVELFGEGVNRGITEVYPGCFKIGENCYTGIEGLKEFDRVLKEKVKKL